MQKNILVAEDEMLIAAQVEEVLEDLGYRPHTAPTVDDALRLLETHSFAAALLDIDLEGKLSKPIADLLADRETPFAVMSGQDLAEIRGSFGLVPVLAKPFSEEQIEETLSELLN
jgi:DNA-binding response OmpR family regulator